MRKHIFKTSNIVFFIKKYVQNIFFDIGRMQHTKKCFLFCQNTNNTSTQTSQKKTIYSKIHKKPEIVRLK
jgi:hypothetical protein